MTALVVGASSGRGTAGTTGAAYLFTSVPVGSTSVGAAASTYEGTASSDQAGGRPGPGAMGTRQRQDAILPHPSLRTRRPSNFPAAPMAT